MCLFIFYFSEQRGGFFKFCFVQFPMDAGGFFIWASKMMLPTKKHLITFFIAAVLIAIFTVLTTMTSSAYEEAERFIREDQAVSSRTGQIKQVKFAYWRRFRYGGDEAVFSFNVEAERGNHRVDVTLKGIDDVWHITNVSVRRFDALSQQ